MSSGSRECARDISARGLGSEQSPDPCRSVQRAGLTSGPASWAHQRCRPKVATCPSSLGHTVHRHGQGGERRRSHRRARHPIRVPAPLAPLAGSPPAALRSLTARRPRLPPLPSYRELNATTYTLHLHLHLNLHTVVGVPPLSRVPARSLVLSNPQTSPCFW